jgi:hypothetical protein
MTLDHVDGVSGRVRALASNRLMPARPLPKSSAQGRGGAPQRPWLISLSGAPATSITSPNGGKGFGAQRQRAAGLSGSRPERLPAGSRAIRSTWRQASSNSVSRSLPMRRSKGRQDADALYGRAPR